MGEETSGERVGQGLCPELASPTGLGLRSYSRFSSECLQAPGDIPRESRGGLSHGTDFDQQETEDWKESADKFAHSHLLAVLRHSTSK